MSLRFIATPVLLMSLMTGFMTSLAAAQGSLFGIYYRTVVVNTKASGAGVTANVANFPLLVRLDSATSPEIFSQAAPGGVDLRVTDAGGVQPIPFELEYWNAAQKRAALWILAPVIEGNDSVDAFRIYWGREGAVSVSSPQAVFDTANGFQAVFHFSEGTHDTGFDATANAFRAAPYNAPRDTLGMMGRGRLLNGTDQRFVIPNSASGPLNFQLTDNYTLSAWVRPEVVTTASSNGHAIIDKFDSQHLFGIYGSTEKRWHLVTKHSNRYLECPLTSDASISAEAAKGSWHLAVATQKGTPIGGTVEVAVYLDGVLLNRCTDTYESNTGRNTTRDVSLGARWSAATGTGLTRYWNGFFDEVRLERRTRDSSWIKLSYMTQRAVNQTGSGTTVRLSPAVNTSVASGRAANAARLSVRESAHGYEFALGPTPGAARARWTLADARGQIVWSQDADLSATRTARWDVSRAAPGVYLLRVALADARGHSLGSATRALPLAR